eukprot:g19420.t1
MLKKKYKGDFDVYRGAMGSGALKPSSSKHVIALFPLSSLPSFPPSRLIPISGRPESVIIPFLPPVLSTIPPYCGKQSAAHLRAMKCSVSSGAAAVGFTTQSPFVGS